MAGTALCDGGIVVDLSHMKGIRVDPARRTVRAEGGVLWRELDHETQAFGLATTGGTVSTTGIAGLTLGGGLGWLMGAYGLSCDNLLSVDIVTADSRLLTASASENQDLFWAVRGGGGNFGVVTSFEYQLHPVGPMVIGGMVLHPLSDAQAVLRFYRDFTRTVPDELTVWAFLLTSPEGAPVVALAACYAGALEDGARAVQPLKEFGTPVADLLGPIPYVALQSMLDAVVPPGRHVYWKSNFLNELSDQAIEILVEQFSAAPSPFSVAFIEHMHGAISRVEPEQTAFAHRGSPYDLAVVAIWEDPSQSQAQISWARGLLATLQPFATEDVYVNYISAPDMGRTQAAYGPNYARLAEIKSKYDPTNFFRGNQNIQPAPAARP